MPVTEYAGLLAQKNRRPPRQGTYGDPYMTSSGQPSVADTRVQPNIVFILADQLRADMCGVYGRGNYVPTPNIDALARQGVRFTRGTATCPLCTPYRGMMLTGRYPTHSGVILNFTDANPVQNPNTLAVILKNAGYDTAFIGKWHLSAGGLRTAGLFEPDFEKIQAYANSDDGIEFTPPGPDRMGFDTWFAYNFHCNFNNYWYYGDEPVKQQTDRYETDVQIDQAIAFMKQRGRSGNPFFLTIAPHPPHPRYSVDELPDGYLDRIPEKIPWSPNVPEDCPRDALEMRCYLAMIAHLDDALGRLLGYLDASGLTDNTIVVFTSDHGEMHGSHGRTDKMVPYAEAIDVPVMVRWPGHVRPDTVSNTLFTPMDFMPTLCGLTGLPAPSECDGIDLSTDVLGTAVTPRESVMIMNYSSNWDFLQSGTYWPEWRGVRSPRYTYCRWLTGEEELYDNDADLYQMTNLANDPAHAATLADLRVRLDAHLAEAHDSLRPGTDFGSWFSHDRRLIATALGPVAPCDEKERL